MPTVRPDIVAGSFLVEDDRGLRMVRNEIIEGLDGSASSLKQAYDAGTYDYSDNDPDFPSLVCRVKDVRHFSETDKKSARIRYEFLFPDFSTADTPVISFTSITREVESNFKPDGTPIIVQYSQPGFTDSTGNIIPAVLTRTLGIRLERRRVGLLQIEMVKPSRVSALEEAEGTVNSQPWQGKPLGTWYFHSVRWAVELYRSGFRYFLEFEYDKRGQFDVVAYRDRHGRIPDNIGALTTAETGNGWAKVQRGELLDFNTLSLPAIPT